MPIEDKHSAIMHHKTVPLLCMTCGFETTIKRPDGRTAHALVEAGYLRELRHELDVLRRADYLFRRFPKSRHKLKASHEQTTPNDSPSDEDRAFAEALAKDQELYDHLKNAGFLLTGRLRFVTQAVAELADEVNARHLSCDNCETGILAPEPGFFSSLC